MATFTVHYGASAPFVARGVHQCRLLSFAARHPGWHTAAPDRTTQRAVTALASRGVLDVVGDQFRINWGLRQTVAWTGGSRPRPLAEVSPEERAKVRALWREQCGLYVGAWGNLLPPSPTCPVSGKRVDRLDMARLFWRHARYDAHATYRQGA